LTTTTHCPAHQRLREQQRGSAAARGYDHRWQRYRKQYLNEHPLCVRCNEQQHLRAASVVDHIIPHRGDEGLFWDPTNHQPLCKDCHDAKTAREDA
jgi:5-methylcytosine-specific restriction protein A